jgi:serine phosphatase RsbU (regulator of sigma subunit)
MKLKSRHKTNRQVRIKLIYSLFILLVSTAAIQAGFSIRIDAQKDSFYTQLAEPDQGFLFIPHTDFLPFSGPQPDSDKDLSAMIWLTWDSTYFYLYAEVQDDTIRVNHSSRPQNDCIELKFDPDPTCKSWVGIINARLTALDSSEAADQHGVDNLYPEGKQDSTAAIPDNYARRRIDNGYAVEMRLHWSWISTDGRTVQVRPGQIFGIGISIHDNDSDRRNGSIQWSVGMADEIWQIPQLLGTAEFLPDHKIKLTRRNAIDPAARPGITYLSAGRLERIPAPSLALENWRYQPGDNPRWADPGFDDHEWEIIYPRLTRNNLPREGWPNIGWFRIHIMVDSSLWGVPLGFSFNGNGPAEIYLNGDSLYYMGKVGTSAESEEIHWQRNPRLIVFKNKPHHVLAIRYSNFSTERLHNLNSAAGFECIIVDHLVSYIDEHTSVIRDMSIFESVFMVIPILLGLLHLFLFIFYPRAKENLYFSLAMFNWAMIIFNDFHTPFYTTINQILLIRIVGSMAISPAIIFGLLTLYVTIYNRIPKQIWFFLLVGLVTTIWIPIQPSNHVVGYTIYGVIGLATLEIFRIMIFSGIKKWRGRWITLFGFGIFMLAIVYQILSGMQILPQIGRYGIVYVYGLLVVSISVSLDLSRNFARTNRSLQQQLLQVKELSQKMLENERRVRADELTRKLLEADNARKTQELEEARQLQLAMLPRSIPAPPYLEIAAEMRTANEVGGDYYDFYLAPDNNLTVAIGDATGHGMRAGTMVASIKSLFAAFGNHLEIGQFFNRCTEILKDMRMGNIYMAMMLVRINENSLTTSAAGMPPILIYRGKSNQVEELVVKGMPLGAHRNFEYEQQATRLAPVDTILLMTDGLSELFNKKKEMLDYEHIKEGLKESAAKPAKEIISDLIRMGETWREGEAQADDYTIIVIKVKAQ